MPCTVPSGDTMGVDTMDAMPDASIQSRQALPNRMSVAMSSTSITRASVTARPQQPRSSLLNLRLRRNASIARSLRWVMKDRMVSLSDEAEWGSACSTSRERWRVGLQDFRLRYFQITVPARRADEPACGRTSECKVENVRRETSQGKVK